MSSLLRRHRIIGSTLYVAGAMLMNLSLAFVLVAETSPIYKLLAGAALFWPILRNLVELRSPAEHANKEMDERRSLSLVPPGLGEAALALLTRSEHREAIIGDADEWFAANVKRFGRKRAVRLYWAEVIRSAAPLLWAAIKRLGIAGLFVDAIRRFLG